jgi:catechol 2,3-dioxygenase-like lactoylglutathione lyase family enzyme
MNEPIISGWHEALLSVSDLDAWVRVYAEVGEWEVRHEGAVSTDVIEYLNVPPGATAREVVLGRKDVNFGLVRLMAFDSGERHPVIRSNGRPWETGGWFDINARIDDMEARCAQLQDLGWGGVSDPIEWQFGPVRVKEWLAYGPDGINWAIIERLDPPLPPEEQPGRMGPHFNSTQIVADIGAARSFYKDLLGFDAVVEVDDQPMMPGPMQNVMGLPNETATSQRWNISMLKAPGAAGGSVELASLPGISGRDFAPLADPPNRGIISLRFPVDDLDALHEKLVAADVPIVNAPQFISLPPGEDVRMMTARGPCGARLDFFDIS